MKEIRSRRQVELLRSSSLLSLAVREPKPCEYKLVSCAGTAGIRYHRCVCHDLSALWIVALLSTSVV
jgi:hypothetical protein